MKKLVLTSRALDGDPLVATFLPDQGMNLISYRKGSIEAIEQSTKDLFADRYAGLGALIGPHFYQQAEDLIPLIPNESFFPHIARVRARGTKDPFAHGLGRYVPWRVLSTPASFSAHISGDDQINGIPYSALEGTPFKMSFEGILTPHGLRLTLQVECERPSVVGFHYYYALTNGEGIVKALVQDQYNDLGTWKPIPLHWLQDKNKLYFDLNEPADFGFRPITKDFSSQIRLETKSHTLLVSYEGINDENAWQLYHPKDAPFACIEPVSAKNPRGATLHSSAISIQISII